MVPRLGQIARTVCPFRPPIPAEIRAISVNTGPISSDIARISVNKTPSSANKTLSPPLSSRPGTPFDDPPEPSYGARPDAFTPPPKPRLP